MKIYLTAMVMLFSVIGAIPLTLSEAVEIVVDEHLTQSQQYFIPEVTTVLRHHTQDLVDYIITTSGRSQNDQDFGKGIWIYTLTEGAIQVFYDEYSRHGLSGLQFLLNYRFGEIPPAPTNWDEVEGLSAQLIEILGEEIAQNFIFDRIDLVQLYNLTDNFHFMRAMSMDVMDFLGRHFSDAEMAEFLEMNYLDRYFRMQDAVLASLRNNAGQFPGLIGLNIMGVMIWDGEAYHRWRRENWVFTLPPRERMVADLTTFYNVEGIDIIAQLGNNFDYFVDFMEIFTYENAYHEARWGGDNWFYWFLDSWFWRSTPQEMLREAVVNTTLTRALGAELATKFLDQVMPLGLFRRIDIFTTLYDNQDLENILREYNHQILDMLDFDILSAITIYLEDDGYMTANLAFVDRLLPGLLYNNRHVLQVMSQWGITPWDIATNQHAIIEFTEADLDLPRTMSPVLISALVIEQPIPGANLILYLRNDSFQLVIFDIHSSSNSWIHDLFIGDYARLEIPYHAMFDGNLSIHIGSLVGQHVNNFEGEFTMMFTRGTQ